jgi:hypothetical protein
MLSNQVEPAGRNYSIFGGVMSTSHKNKYAQSQCGELVTNALRAWYNSLNDEEKAFIDEQALCIIRAVKATNGLMQISADGAIDVVLRMAFMHVANGDLRNMVEV